MSILVLILLTITAVHFNSNTKDYSCNVPGAQTKNVYFAVDQKKQLNHKISKTNLKKKKKRK